MAMRQLLPSRNDRRPPSRSRRLRIHLLRLGLVLCGVTAAGPAVRTAELHFDPQNPPPLCNLYVSMLQRLGIETDKFSSGTKTLTGLEPVG